MRHRAAGALLIATSVLYVAGYTLWAKTRSVDPVERSITSLPATFSAEFSSNIDTVYLVELTGVSDLPTNAALCILGINRDDYRAPPTCESSTQGLIAKWSLSDDGHTIKNYTASGHHGGTTLAQNGFLHSLGRFSGRDGHKYGLSVSFDIPRNAKHFSNLLFRVQAVPMDASELSIGFVVSLAMALIGAAIGGTLIFRRSE